MSQITALISGSNQNYDYQLTALARALVNPGVLSGLAVTSGAVAPGEGFILCTRTNGQQVMVHYTNTASVAVTTSGTTKVWVGISQSVIDDGSTNAVDGTGIATIQTGASYPVTGAYIPLASIASGTITDARVMISGKPIKRTNFTPNTTIETDGSGNEILRSIGSGTTILSTETIRKKKADGTFEDILYSTIKNDLGSAGKYVQSLPVGESISAGDPTILTVVTSKNLIDIVPTLTSNAGNSAYITSASGEYNGSYSAYYAFNGFDSDGWMVSLGNTSNQWLQIDFSVKRVISAISILSDSTVIPAGWQVQGYNGSTWDVLYTATVAIPTSITKFQFYNTTSYRLYRIFIGNLPGGGRIKTVNFDEVYTAGVEHTNTLGANIAGSRVKSGIRFSVPYNTTLGMVKTSQISSSVNARVQLFADDGTTLIAEQTPSSTDTVIFPNTTISANTVYRLVVNDSAYFAGNNNELALASYQANMQFCVSGTLNGVNTVEPQNIKWITLGTMKAMKAVLTNPLAGFVSGPRNKGDLLQLNANDGALISGFSGLTPFVRYHKSNTPGVITSSDYGAPERIGLAVSPTEIYISTSYYPGTNVTKP